MQWNSVVFLLLTTLAYADKDHHSDHEVILGSRKAASEFDELQVDEAKKRLNVIANRMDADKDGFVEAEELTNWISNAMFELDKELVVDRLKELDINEDESVTWKEFLMDSFGEQDISTLDSDDKKLMAEDKSYFEVTSSNSFAQNICDLFFRKMNENKDGKLNSEELSVFLNHQDFKHMYSALIEVALLQKDINIDGAIDVKEFLEEMADAPDSEQKNEVIKRFTTVYDKDNDGFLRDDEILQWIISDVSVSAKQETLHLIEAADKDGDGKLSITEILDEHYLFVGSKATNYGDALHKIENTEL